MADIIDRMELSNDQRVELHERGVVWLAQVPDGEEWPDCAMNLDASAAIMLLEFLLKHHNVLASWLRSS